MLYFKLVLTSLLGCSLVAVAFDLSSSRRSIGTSSFATTMGRRPLVLPKSSSTLQMHMGHSHAHHHHHQKTSSLTPKRRLRRRVASVFFAALATLALPLYRRRAIHKTHIAIFVITSALLAVSDQIRGEVRRIIGTIRSFASGIKKHAPENAHSPSQWIQYLFKNENAADQVTLFGGLINLVLSLGKFAVGVTCHSSALIADAGHSLSDLFSDVITLWAVQMGRLPPDEDHPYGHGKFEAIGSLFLALTLLGTGISVGASSNQKLLEIIAVQQRAGLTAVAQKVPTLPALIMAGLSIVSKEWLFRLTKQVGERLKSQVVIANAWHHRSDAYSSVLALGAIGLAMYFPSLVAADAAAGMLVAGMICMTGAEILGESIKQLTDTTNETLVTKIRYLAQAQSSDANNHNNNKSKPFWNAASEQSADDHSFHVKRVRARQVGSLALVDVDIGISGTLSSAVSRRIAEKLRQNLLSEVAEDVLDVEVHATTIEDDQLLDTTTTNSNGKTNEQETEANTPPTAAQIETNVRDHIDSNHMNDVNSVEGVSVRYDFAEDESTILHTNVDVMIQIDPDTTVATARSLASDLRESIENLDNIHKASIFLDLNTNVPTMKSSNLQ